MFVKDFKLSLRIENLTERARIDNLTKKKQTPLILNQEFKLLFCWISLFLNLNCNFKTWLWIVILKGEEESGIGAY